MSISDLLKRIVHNKLSESLHDGRVFIWSWSNDLPVTVERNNRAVLQKDGLGECALVPVFGSIVQFFVPSFRFLGSAVPGFCILVPVLGGPGNICQNHPFGNHPVLQPPTLSGVIRANRFARFARITRPSEIRVIRANRPDAL